jgi:hypothetical protein
MIPEKVGNLQWREPTKALSGYTNAACLVYVDRSDKAYFWNRFRRQSGNALRWL